MFSLYAFVRKADNFVDSTPQDIQGFYDFKNNYYNAISGAKTDDVVIDSFVKLSEKKDFKPEWTEAFLKSMESDIKKSSYTSIEETIDYMYGSAEVIGLYMSKILDLPNQAFYYAKYLGRSMQYINFIRDISEDINLNRTYMPIQEIKEFGLNSLEYNHVKEFPEEFTNFIHKQLEYYCKWQTIAEEGYKFIPKKYLIPIKTAAEMYNWTANQIYKNPYVIYNRQVKPMVKQIFTTTFLNIIDPKKNNNRLDLCILKNPTHQISY